MVINEKDFYNQPIYSVIKKYEEIKKLTTSQGEDYTTGCLLNHYMLIAIDLSRQNVLDTDLKTIQQIKFVVQLKKLDDNGNVTGAGNDQSVFVLTILEKIKDTISLK